MTSDCITTTPGAARILVVEDEVLIQMLFVSYLEEFGLVADVVGTAAEALERVASPGTQLAVAILDLGLPDSDGDTLVREVRRLRPDLPIIISSGYDRRTLRARFADGHGHIFLTKPFRSDDLRAILVTLGVVGHA